MKRKTKLQKRAIIRLGHGTLVRVMAAVNRISLREARYHTAGLLNGQQGAHDGCGVLMHGVFGGPVLRLPPDAKSKAVLTCWVATYSYDHAREVWETKCVVDHARRGWRYDPKTRTRERLMDEPVWA